MLVSWVRYRSLMSKTSLKKERERCTVGRALKSISHSLYAYKKFLALSFWIF
jgi:hypothetical protein